MKIEEMYGTVEETAPSRQAPATAGMPMIKKESMGKKAMPPPTVSENAVVQDVAKRATEAEAASPFPFQNVADIAAQVAGSPVAQAAAAALLGGYAYKKGSEIIGESKAKKGLSDRLFNTQGRVEPSMATRAQPSPLAPTNQFPGTPQELEKALGPNWQKAMQQSDELRRQRQAQAQIEINKQMGMPTAPAPAAVTPAPAAPAAPAAPSAPQTTQQIAQTLGVPPAPEPTVAQIAQAAAPGLQAAAQQPVDMIPPATEAKKAGRPPKGQENKATFKAGEAMPEGMVFKEGFGGADNWMKNSFNDEARIMIRDLFNEGKPYGANMDKAYADAKMYEQWLKENIPVQTYSRAERKAAGLPPPENYGKLGKAAKVAGVTGLLMTAQQAANAAQGQNRTRDLLNAIGEFFTPLSMTPSTVQPGTLGPEQLRAFEEAQKLGSPYRQAR